VLLLSSVENPKLFLQILFFFVSLQSKKNEKEEWEGLKPGGDVPGAVLEA
jgi:hypothetical protein